MIAGRAKTRREHYRSAPRRYSFYFPFGVYRRSPAAAVPLNVIAGRVHRHLVDYLEPVVDVERQPCLGR